MAKAKPPTKTQRERWSKITQLGCYAGRLMGLAASRMAPCRNMPSIHHAETGMGGRKDHDKIIPLCHFHHQGEQGIHTLSRRIWQPIYGYERDMLEQIKIDLGEIQQSTKGSDHE